MTHLHGAGSNRRTKSGTGVPVVMDLPLGIFGAVRAGPRRQFLSHILIILGFPLMLLGLQPGWIFNDAYRDPWIYYGYFRRAPALLSAFGDLYYSSRLSVIVPGYALHSLFSPIVAKTVLHLVLCWSCCLFLYVLGSFLVGPTASLVATLLFAGDPFVLEALGSDYSDAFGICYGLGACFLFATAARSRQAGIFLFLGGLCLGALVVANISYGLLALPPLVIFGALQKQRTGRFTLLPGLIWAGIGAMAALLILAAASHVLGGPVLFLRSTLLLIGNPRSEAWLATFKAHGLGWLGQAMWLVLPAVAVLAGTLRLLFRRQTADAAVWLTQVQIMTLVFPLVALEFTQLASVNHFLEQSYYASLLLPGAYLSIMGLLRVELPENVKADRLVLLTAMAVTAAGAVFWFGGARLWRLLEHIQPPILPAFLVGVAAAALLGLGARGTTPAALSVAMLVVAQNFAMHTYYRFGPQFSSYHYDKRGVFRQIDDAVELLKQNDPSALAHYWFARSEKASQLFDLISSTSVSNYRTLIGNFPNLQSCWTRDGLRLRPGMRIAVLSGRPDADQEARAGLARCEVVPQLLADRQINGPAGPFRLSLYRLEAAGQKTSLSTESPSSPR